LNKNAVVVLTAKPHKEAGQGDWLTQRLQSSATPTSDKRLH